MDDATHSLQMAKLELAAWIEHGDWHGLAALIREDSLRPGGPLLTPAFVWFVMQSSPWTSRQNISCWFAHFHLWWENSDVSSWTHASLLVDDRLISVERLLVASAMWVKSSTQSSVPNVEASRFFYDYHGVYCELSWRDPVKKESVRFLATLAALDPIRQELAWPHRLLTLLHPSKHLLIDTIWRSESDAAQVFDTALECIAGATEDDVALVLPEEID